MFRAGALNSRVVLVLSILVLTGFSSLKSMTLSRLSMRVTVFEMCRSFFENLSCVLDFLLK